MKRSGFTDHERRVVIERREEEKVGHGVVLLDLRAVGKHSHEGSLVVKAFFVDHALHVARGVTGADEEHAEREIFDLLERFYDEACALFPDVLAHEQEHELVLSDAELAAHVREILVRIIGDQVATVVHHLHFAFVTVFINDVLDGLLRHPDFVRLLVEGDDGLDHFVHHESALQHAHEVVAVLGVEGGHHGDILHLRNSESSLARAERTVGMDYLELPLKQAGEVDRIHFGHSGDIGMAERDGNRGIAQDFIIVLTVIGRRDVGSDDSHTADLLLEPVSIVFHTDRHAVHHGRERVAAQTYIKIFSHYYS